MKRLFTFIIVVICISSCRQSPVNKEDIRNLGDQINSLTTTAKEVFSSSDISVDELKKLRQLEYAIFSFPSSDSNEQIAKFLSGKGLDRWDCFHVEKQRTKENEIELAFYCKRPVETPLRYLPNTVIGR